MTLLLTAVVLFTASSYFLGALEQSIIPMELLKRLTAHQNFSELKGMSSKLLVLSNQQFKTFNIKQQKQENRM